MFKSISVFLFLLVFVSFVNAANKTNTAAATANKTPAVPDSSISSIIDDLDNDAIDKNIKTTTTAAPAPATPPAAAPANKTAVAVAPANKTAAAAPKPLSLDPNSPLRFLKAEFGKDKFMLDVTDKINAMVKDGKINICVKGVTFGDNSKSTGGRKLKVNYVYQGKEISVVIGEGDYLQIPDPVPDAYSRNEYPENREDLSCVDFDYYGFPFYIGTVYPEAQNAVYSDKFIPMSDLSIVLGPQLKKDDWCIVVLMRKLEKWGVKFDVSDKITSKKTQILLNVPDYGKAVPKKEEAYSITCTEKGSSNFIAVNAKDKLGLLWGIVSVLQLTKHENSELAMRSAEISDYPDRTTRSFQSNRWDRVYEVMIFFKIRRVIIQGEPFEGNGWNWREPGPPITAYLRCAEICHGLGLDFYAKIHPAESTPKFIASSEKDFDQLIWLIKKYYASKHMNLYWAYDDIRFRDGGLPPQDEKKFGTAAKTDSYAVQRLFTEVRKEYPDFKMVFCPPYYWTTGIYKGMYGESGPEYIKTLAKTLDPSIGIYWTGPQVATYEYPKDRVAEIVELMGRKPWIFKNRPGEHQANRSLPTDERNWAAMGYPEFINDIDSLNTNTSGAAMAHFDATLCDYIWNTSKFNAKRSAKNAATMMFSPEVYPYLKNVCDNLSSFDAYTNGKPGAVSSANVASAINLASIEQSMREIKGSMDEIRKLDKRNIVSKLSSVDELIWFVTRCANDSRDPKLLSGLPAYSVREFAVQEAQMDAKKDIFFTVDACNGGFARGFVPSSSGERYAKTFYGAKSKYSTMSLSFGADPFPPSNDYEVYISGMVFNKGGDCKISVAVNHTIIYEGPSGLGKSQFGIKKLIIPMSAIQKSNTMTITNMEDSDNLGDPCIAISYIVMKKL